MYLVFASILAGIPLICLPVRAQQPVENCLTAPNQKAPEGSQWHFRTDRAGTRKCYFLRADADKLRSVTTVKPERQRDPVPSPLPDTVSGPQFLGQPMPPSRTEDGVISARWPDPAKALGSVVADSTGSIGSIVGDASSPVDTGMTVDAYGTVTDQPSADAAAPAPEPGPGMNYRLMLAFVAGALVVAGIIARVTVGFVRTPRPRGTAPRRSRRDIARLLSRLRDMTPSIPALASSIAARAAPIAARAASIVPWHFRRQTMRNETTTSAVPAQEDVNLVPALGNADDRQEQGDDIDVLLRQIERLGERPAA